MKDVSFDGMAEPGTTCPPPEGAATAGRQTQHSGGGTATWCSAAATRADGMESVASLAARRVPRYIADRGLSTALFVALCWAARS